MDLGFRLWNIAYFCGAGLPHTIAKRIQLFFLGERGLSVGCRVWGSRFRTLGFCAAKVVTTPAEASVGAGIEGSVLEMSGLVYDCASVLWFWVSP